MPKKRTQRTDTVRASRDGHEYHENWTARIALRLLWPDCPLSGIAVESLSPTDQLGARSETTDIADLALYYGGSPTFEHAKTATVQQFKYSIADAKNDFRASDAKKTIEKFAKTYTDYRQRFGAAAVSDKLSFELVTNRPIHPDLQAAIDALAKGIEPTGKQEKMQAKQFTDASGLRGKSLSEFAAKFRLQGRSGNLSSGKHDLAKVIIDWSGAEDSVAAARLGQLKQMVRDKAGHAGTLNNVIYRTDLLSVLDVADAEDLLPCKPELAAVGPIVEREQFNYALRLLPTLSKPLMIHATGGVGKTVFMTRICEAVSTSTEVVFFDCFGGGAYRSPADARHLPKRGLIHIANTLAFRGLCDPILPGSSDDQALLSTFRRRLEQTVNALEKMSPGRTLAIFIDAIDNAQLYADERGQTPFPKFLLESVYHKPVAGVTFIVSCRTERRLKTYVPFEDFELRPFSDSETTAYLRSRLNDVSDLQIGVAQSRSGGNPRVLQYLVQSGRGLLDESELNKKIELEDLIERRITDALATAVNQGYAQADIDVFLAGLAVLPPPVPMDEYAAANGMEVSAIRSFASDLRPLLEQTVQGIMFRDEPTETLVRKKYATSEPALRRVAVNLWKRQDSSVYAARALPFLLQRLNDGDQLFKLAFDASIPSSITSTVGKRNIRYARIKAAVSYAADKKNYNHLVRLLMELSTIAAVDQRGTDYILENPDLVVAAKDTDAMRRLFEARRGWPGSRHARLAIANFLSGESGEAHRHATAAYEWIEHYRRTPGEDRFNEPHPERLDISAIPLHLVSHGRPERAARYFQLWYPWYSYEVCEHTFEYLHLALSMRLISATKINKFVASLADVGGLTGALSFHKSSQKTTKELIHKLAKAAKASKDLQVSNHYRAYSAYQIQDGLRKASTTALAAGLRSEARTICLCIPYRRPRLHTMRQRFFNHDLVHFVFRAALLAAASGEPVAEKDVLPDEIASICSRLKKTLKGEELKQAVKGLVVKAVEKGKRESRKEKKGGQPQKVPGTLNYEEQQEADRFLNTQFTQLLDLTESLRAFLTASGGSVDKRFVKLLDAWDTARKSSDLYRTEGFDSLFSQLGLELTLFALWARPGILGASIKKMLLLAHQQRVPISKLIQIVAILAQKVSLHEIAGEQAIKARELIEAEDDVTQRGSLFADLSRAILPASVDEATSYFHLGLEQMDAIGSGDYEFTNNLVLFAASMKGRELDEKEIHALTNICELNLGEPRKFYWGAFGQGMSRAGGLKGLAKLARWDDRSVVSMEYTLLPYLIALVEDGKIDPELALSINRLANPAEYFESGTKQFVRAIEKRLGANREAVVSELIQQYEDDNPSVSSDTTVGRLAELAEAVFGKASDTTQYLRAAQPHFSEVRDTRNDHTNYHGGDSDPVLRRRQKDAQDRETRVKLKALIRRTDPSDTASLARALTDLENLENMWDMRGDFFAALRAKLPFPSRVAYISEIAGAESLNWYTKTAELKACKTAWGASSNATVAALSNLALPLVHLHANEIVEDGRFAGYRIREITDLTGVAESQLVLELIKVFSQPGASTSGTVWLGFSWFVVPEADAGEGQEALKRLLSSEAAELANKVKDGPWQAGLYPTADAAVIASGLVWQALGSPYAERRWRAAHSMRALARFQRWDVINAIVKQWSTKDAGPFQAKELEFFYLHARLWLLIALARLALDHPKEVASHNDLLTAVVTEGNEPHVLMRHFAARALIACLDAGALTVDPVLEKTIRSADASPLPRLHSKVRTGGDFYGGRSDSARKPAFEFHFDYDFHKVDIDNLSQVFGKGCWDVSDMMAEIVHAVNPGVKGMHDDDGRRSSEDDRYGLSGRKQSLAQQLGWHALFLAAGKLLQTWPVTDDSWYGDNPWEEWLKRYTLTRDDGLWLSDGTDRTPLETEAILLKKMKDGLGLTGDKDKLLGLLGISPLKRDIVIDGEWYSSDSVRVHVSSALIDPTKADKVARKLIRTDPMLVGIQSLQSHEDDQSEVAAREKGVFPWVVTPPSETRLDEYDPYTCPDANRRPHLAKPYASDLHLQKQDVFGRAWQDNRSRVILKAEAWGRENRDSDGGLHAGVRLVCSLSALRKILRMRKRVLIILLVLRRYEKREPRESTQYTHTVAVLLIGSKTGYSYLPGRINHLHKSRY